MNLGGGLNRPRPSETDPPAFLHWTTPPLPQALDLAGPIELQLDAACTAPDTAFIVVLQDVDQEENTTNVTSGYLRAGLRTVDQAASKQGAPVLPCRVFDPVVVGQRITYRIPLVPNARRFRAGHQLRLHLTSDDQNKDAPALLEFRHASVGTSSFNTVFSSSRLLLPLLGAL
jgi:predicted acyl esterase